jgi:hypothetical protein
MRRKLYVQYLSTSALVRSIEHGERELSTARQQRDTALEAVWKGVLDDLRYELSVRQMVLLVDALGDDVGEQVAADVDVKPGADLAAQESDCEALRDHPSAVDLL